MKDYGENKKSSYFKYQDLNNLYGWAMSQKLPICSYKWVKNISQFGEGFLRNYNEDSHVGCYLEVDVQYPGKLCKLHNDLSFLPQIMKIEKIEKVVNSSEMKFKGTQLSGYRLEFGNERFPV